jgi:DNA polymerase
MCRELCVQWSERQRLMLAEMGIRVWEGPSREDDATADSAVSRLEVSAAEPSACARAVLLPTPATEPPAKAASAATAALDWPQLRAAVASCTACMLCESRTQTVFGVGHPRAHWMVVGEAPGEEEDERGEPFVGRSGRLLDSMLRSIQLSRHAPDDAPADPARQVYIANTLKCRPPRNRDPLPDELARCEGFLIRQIELVQPRLILAMGRFAVQSLLRSKEPIGRLRGRVHRYQNVPLVVTYHPAYLLRSPLEKARAWDDLCLALDTVEAMSPAQSAGTAPPA